MTYPFKNNQTEKINPTRIKKKKKKKQPNLKLTKSKKNKKKYHLN